MTTTKPKREFERHSGTGGSIKSDAKRSGGGQHNWGGDQEVIEDAVTAHKEAEAAAVVAATQPTANTTNPPPSTSKDDLAPESLGDLVDAAPKPNDMSYEEFMKQQQQSRTGVKAYDARTVDTNFRPDRYKGKNYFEKATDELLQGAQKEKKKRKKARKQQKVIKPEYSFHPASGPSDYRGGGAPRGGRGRGRGRGGGEGGFNSSRQYGAGGGVGGDRGYSRGYGGFGSRGRGRRNDENVDSDMPPQRPQPQYRLKTEGANEAVSAPPNNNESLNLPQPIA